MWYKLLNSLLKVLSKLPLGVHYFFAHVIAFLAHRVVCYRRKTVRENLQRSFPDISEQQRRTIERCFYQNLSMCMVETIWMMSATEEDVKNHVEFRNMELITEAFDQGRNVTALFGHIGNWEWICTTPLFLRPNDAVATLYKPLTNTTFDKIYYDMRSRFGVHCIPKNQALRALVDYKRRQQPMVLAFIADQSPSRNSLHFFTSFLHQRTPFITGWEELSKRQDSRVIYVDIQRPKPGHYIYTVEMLCDHSKDETPYTLTERYANRLEENILLCPELWLWSHRRWKHSDKKMTPRHGIVNS
ncbi:MAG: lysophospholipid acyltransferase family protein [Bacteroidales bacterium]|nr:lysophospholipid acyltransferase family protein [Bacteroidales bacterium]